MQTLFSKSRRNVTVEVWVNDLGMPKHSTVVISILNPQTGQLSKAYLQPDDLDWVMAKLQQAKEGLEEEYGTTDRNV